MSEPTMTAWLHPPKRYQTIDGPTYRPQPSKITLTPFMDVNGHAMSHGQCLRCLSRSPHASMCTAKERTA